MHFGENQLSPFSFGISPLPTAHPSSFVTLHRFGPPRPVTDASPWPWVAHTVSGLLAATNALFTLAFRCGSGCNCLNRPPRVTRRVILQKARDHPDACRSPTALTAWTRSVSGSISLPSPGCFSPFPHGTVRYRSRPVGSLGQWSARLPTRIARVRVVLKIIGRSVTLSGLRDCHALWCGVPAASIPRSSSVLRRCSPTVLVSQPQTATRAGLTRPGLGGIPFRSPLLRDAYSSSGYMRCFSSPGSLPRKCAGHRSHHGWGCPIRRWWAQCLLRLPHAYRSCATSFIGWSCRGILRPRILSCLVMEYSRS